ncbi:MAG: ribokinase [Acidimicrobiia bacterium]
MRVVVVGSINEDLVARVSRLPTPGETVSGTGHSWHGGGKGANQAVAAARLGAEVAMIGRVGDDESGRRRVADLMEEGINVDHIGRDGDIETGLALILVDAQGQNVIAASPGANHALTPEHVVAGEELLSEADVVLLQLEIPDTAVSQAAKLAPHRVILNAAPARDLDPGLPLDVTVVNATELATLTGRPIRHSTEDFIGDARAVGGAVVVTLGEGGAVISSHEAGKRMPAPSVNPVDTTGAGDAFCGALAVSIGEGKDLETAVGYAVAAGAAATLKPGAQPSLPYPDEVEALL